MVLKDIFDFSNITILCVGDVILDSFVYGQVERISPESPVPVLHHQHQFTMLGGAGNVIRNITSLGGKVIFISVLGDDPIGADIHQHLKDLKNVQTKLFTEKNRRTIRKTRFIAQGQHLLRVDEEVIVPITLSTEDKIIEAVQEVLPSCQAVILSDYSKGLFQNTLCQSIIKKARAFKPNLPIIVDPKGKTYQRYEDATVLTPNLKELKEVTGHCLKTPDDIMLQSRQLKKKLNIDSILVTQGAQGMTLIEKDEDPYRLPAKAKEVYDVSGAGDTVVATLSLALGAGSSLKQASYLANEAAGIVVGKIGTATVSQQELESASHTRIPNQKIVCPTQAQELLKYWRYQGLKIGFTNGCFDLLHLGHLHILQEAAQACDKLIVGLNTDTSIQRLKGQDRPIQNQDTRAMVLAALSMVDAVVLFEEDTPENLIYQLCPDVLVKGADYTIDRVVGADFVQARGGKVLLVNLQPGHSTTTTVTKIKAA